jgi:WD domain, G-beta repeat
LVGARALFASAIVLLGLGAVGGCGEKDSLIVVTASTYDYTNVGLHHLVVSAGSTSGKGATTTRTFNIAQDLTVGLITVGLYIPSSLTGSVTVTAEGVGTACGPGFSGSMTVVVPSAGSTVTADILMADTTTCPPTTGSGGSTGRGGSGGGTGGTGATSGPNCIEVDHGTTGSCATCTPGSGTTADVQVYGVAFSPTNPQLVVTGGGDGHVKVWSVGAGGTLTAQQTLPAVMGLSLVAFAPDGNTLAVGRNGSIDIVDVSTWTVTRSLSITGDTYGIGFTSDASYLVAVGYTTTTKVEVLSAYTNNASTQPAFTATVTNGYALAVSPKSSGGSTQVAVTTSDGNVQVFTLSSTGFSAPAVLSVTGSTSQYAETAAFSPHGDLLASGGDDGYLNFWTLPVTAGALPDASPIDIFSNTFSTEVWSAAFSPDQTHIALGGGVAGSLSIWNVAAPRAAASGEFDTANGAYVVSLAYSPSGNLIVGGENGCGCVLVCPL